MNLTEQIKADVKQFTTDTDSGFAVTLVTYNTAGAEIELRGTTARHHTSYDTDGVKISSRNAHVSISESEFTDKGIVTRNADGNVDLLRRRFRVTDSSGLDREYIVSEQYPDETVGLIVMILTEYDG